MKNINFTRLELYNLVWSESLPKISKKYNITYTQIRKACTDMGITLPKNGYWQNVEIGNPVLPEPFLETSTGKQDLTLHLLEEGDIRTANPKTRKKFSAEDKSDRPDLVIVPKRLSNPDDLVAAAKVNLLSTKYTSYRYKGLISTDSNHLDINVTKPNIERALRFMDTIVKAIKERGYTIEINHRGTYITLGEEGLKITLREMFTSEPSTKPHTFTEYKSTGILCFTMDEFYPSQFKDSAQKIEDRIPDIILRLEQKAQKHKERSEYYDRMRAEQEQADRIKREKQERKEKELADFKKLLSDAKRWKEAQVIREYVQAIESDNVGTISEDRQAWIEWAKKKADWYDPKINRFDEILIDLDKA